MNGEKGACFPNIQFFDALNVHTWQTCHKEVEISYVTHCYNDVYFTTRLLFLQETALRSNSKQAPFLQYVLYSKQAHFLQYVLYSKQAHFLEYVLYVFIFVEDRCSTLQTVLSRSSLVHTVLIEVDS